jgi:hypothetical protein
MGCWKDLLTDDERGGYEGRRSRYKGRQDAAGPVVGDVRQVTQGSHLGVQRGEVPLKSDRIGRARTLGTVRAASVVNRSGTGQQVADFVQPNTLGLQLADRRDAFGVRGLVEAEVTATSTNGSEQSQTCVEVHSSPADTGAGRYLTDAKKVFGHHRRTHFPDGRSLPLGTTIQ